MHGALRGQKKRVYWHTHTQNDSLGRLSKHITILIKLDQKRRNPSTKQARGWETAPEQVPRNWGYRLHEVFTEFSGFLFLPGKKQLNIFLPEINKVFPVKDTNLTMKCSGWVSMSVSPLELFLVDLAAELPKELC